MGAGSELKKIKKNVAEEYKECGRIKGVDRNKKGAGKVTGHRGVKGVQGKEGGAKE